MLLALPEADQPEAEGCLRRAIAVAQEQSARWWELRAATSLARLWAGQGRRAEAYDLLAPIYGWFTEGFDTPDLREARALLDELASAPHGSRARPRRRPAAPGRVEEGRGGGRRPVAVDGPFDPSPQSGSPWPVVIEGASQEL